MSSQYFSLLIQWKRFIPPCTRYIQLFHFFLALLLSNSAISIWKYFLIDHNRLLLNYELQKMGVCCVLFGYFFWITPLRPSVRCCLSPTHIISPSKMVNFPIFWSKIGSYHLIAGDFRARRRNTKDVTTSNENCSLLTNWTCILV